MSPPDHPSDSEASSKPPSSSSSEHPDPEHQIKLVNTMEDNTYANIEYSARRAQAAAIATEAEHRMTVRYTLKRYPRLTLWCCVFNFIALAVEYCKFINIKTRVSGAFVEEYGWKPWFRLILPAGEIAGLFLGSMVSDKKGRKTAIAFGIIISAFFSMIETAANSQALLLVCMALSGVGLGMLRVSALVYCSEIAPVSLRGLATAGIPLNRLSGMMLGNLSTHLFLKLPKTEPWTYRGPVILQLLFLFVIAFFLPMAPETPWWRARKTSVESARGSLHRIYGRYEDVTNITFAIEKTVAQENEMRAGCPYIAALTLRRHARRTLIVFGAFVCSALAGYGFVQRVMIYPFPLHIDRDDAVSFRDVYVSLGCAQAGGILCLLLVSTLGRRRSFVSGAILLPLILLAFAVVQPHDTTNGTAHFALGCVYLFVYSATIGGIAYVLVADVSAPIFRSATAGMALMIHTFLTSGVDYAAPYIIKGMGGSFDNACFLFAGLGGVGAVWAYFFVPELKRRTFEEVNELFDSRGVGVRRMRKYEV